MSCEGDWERYVKSMRLALAAAERFAERVPAHVGDPDKPRRALGDGEAEAWLALARETEEAVRSHRLHLEAFVGAARQHVPRRRG